VTHDILPITMLPAPGGGTIAMSSCPGRLRDGVQRDMAADIAAIRAAGTTAVLTLMQRAEFRLLGVPKLAQQLTEAGFAWLHAPIRDVHVPDAAWERAWTETGGAVHLRLARNETVLLHCRAGLGRSGTIAARLLCERGMPADAAIGLVRARRTPDRKLGDWPPPAIETPEQEEHVRAVAAGMGFADRVRGMLLGGAMGDALGAAIEFWDMPEIRRRCGASGPRDPLPAYGHPAPITDDTQMTLFTAEGLLANPGDRVAGVRDAYLRWLGTQSGKPAPGLASVPALLSARAPGNTCLAALQQGEFPARNKSKGCGAVMRAAPCGAVTSDAADAFALGVATGRLTHAHPSGFLPAGVLAALVHALLRATPLPRALDEAVARLPRGADADETRDAIAAARAAARQPFSVRALERLGAGWTGEEALAISLYAVLTAAAPEDAIVHAVTHGGDSDSTGAIAGNILGAMLGTAWLPDRWAAKLELRQTILGVADGLAGAGNP
jgi:ADP-ribosylglycohydrolase/protein-tyrosine phosphatase